MGYRNGKDGRNNDIIEESSDELFLEEASSGFFDNEDVAPSSRASLGIAQKENRAVWCLRFVVVTLFTSVALAICLTVYFLATQQEQDDFERGFEEMSGKVVEGFESILRQRLGIIESLAMDMVAYEKNTPNVSFPFMTMPDFEHRAAHVGKLADAMSLAFFPLITEEQRDEFDAYAQEHQGWRAEGMSYRTGQSLEEVQELLKPIAPSIWGIYKDGPGTETRPGPYIVQWQGFPSTPQLPILMNIGTHPHYVKPLAHVMKHHQPVFPPSYDFMDPASHEKDPRRPMIQSFLESYESYNAGVKYEDDPVMPLLFPILQASSGNVAGILISGVYWRTYFRDLLPRSATGVDVILQNTCGQEYTYRVDGAEARFVGHGDLHDTAYDYLGTGLDLADFSVEQGEQTGNCLYGIRVYPSQEFEEGYTSQKPMLYTIILAAVFFFTSAAFILYDYCVERRQQLVLKSATQSGALVSSLFPEVVRQRLLEEQEQKRREQQQQKTWKHDESNTSNNQERASAIANLYPECTVLFADISGFTKWSSTRTPQEVFKLLETIYESFDKVAARRKVFKVETIGDCYVAVTGIPQAQPDHAVRMCKFASSCMRELHNMIHDPEVLDSLGQDTNQLAMRFGLHSGPVTAGVLRGEKSRFQIFGDTVNTAARMESNGLPHRIQVSESTAKLLMEAGKRDWVAPRADLVAAKGKGTMQTYWVSDRAVPASTMGDRSIMGDSSLDYSANPSASTWKQRETPNASPMQEESLEGTSEDANEQPTEESNSGATDNYDDLAQC